MKVFVDIFATDLCLPAVYTIQTQAVDNGSISLTPNKSKYCLNETVICQASPLPGYNFLTWRGDSISKNALTTITVTKNMNLVARFIKDTVISRIIIFDTVLVHAQSVEAAFKQGYLDSTGIAFPDTIEIKIGSPYNFSYADTKGSELIICSTAVASQYRADAQKYYPSLFFMPAGSNIHYQITDTNGTLPVNVVTGCGTIANLTAWDIEHFQDDPFGGNASSFSNGYLAGIFVAASDNGFNKDYSAIRHYSQKNKIWTPENGYGLLVYADIVNPANLAEFNANILSDANYYRKLDSFLTQ